MWFPGFTFSMLKSSSSKKQEHWASCLTSTAGCNYSQISPNIPWTDRQLNTITKALRKHQIQYQWIAPAKMSISHNSSKHAVASLQDSLGLLQSWNIIPYPSDTLPMDQSSPEDQPTQPLPLRSKIYIALNCRGSFLTRWSPCDEDSTQVIRNLQYRKCLLGVGLYTPPNMFTVTLFLFFFSPRGALFSFLLVCSSCLPLTCNHSCHLVVV